MLKTLFRCQKGDLKSKTFLQYQVGKIGRDWLISITGGESHIGGFACSNKENNEIFTQSLTHHKEGTIISEAYKQLSQLVDTELMIISGIHYDQISQSQIKKILQHNKELIDLTSEFLIST